MKPTVVTLGPGSIINSVVRYEDAFGEFSSADGEDFSELRGRGRKRRHKRKMERQQNRIARRRARKQARQQIRNEQQEARQNRKDIRKSRRVARKEMGNSGEDEMEQEMATPDGNGSGEYSTTQNSDMGQEPQGNYEPTPRTQAPAPQYASQEEEWGGGAPAMEEESYQEDAPEVDADSYDSEDAYYESEFAGGRMKVHPGVQDTADKIEWNKILIDKLKQDKEFANADGDTVDAAIIDEHIADRTDRIGELESFLEGYESLDGDFESGADGNWSYARGKGRGVGRKSAPGQAKRAANKEKRAARKKRRAEVKAARKIAVKKRIAARKAKKVNRRAHGGDENASMETEVEKDLNPTFDENYIEVPAEENFDGRGQGGNAYSMDFDAPTMAEFEVKSNFNGVDDNQMSYADGIKSKKINWTAIAIGVGVGVLAVYAIKKYKLLGNK